MEQIELQNAQAKKAWTGTQWHQKSAGGPKKNAEIFRTDRSHQFYVLKSIQQQMLVPLGAFISPSLSSSSSSSSPMSARGTAVSSTNSAELLSSFGSQSASRILG
uniref:Uncharacterized protein n=1 Tax=Globodera rostochiensis TaxID=31243 RepID=A0A914HSI3_GLORO